MNETEKPAKRSLLDIQVIYPNVMVLLFACIAAIHIGLAFTSQTFVPSFLNGLLIGLFATVALSELGLRWRLRKFGRV
jgi:hypothetical protein